MTKVEPTYCKDCLRETMFASSSTSHGQQCAELSKPSRFQESNTEKSPNFAVTQVTVTLKHRALVDTFNRQPSVTLSFDRQLRLPKSPEHTSLHFTSTVGFPSSIGGVGSDRAPWLRKWDLQAVAKPSSTIALKALLLWLVA